MSVFIETILSCILQEYICNYDMFYVQVTIPANDTTYWCAAFQLPEEIHDQTKYITKVSSCVSKQLLLETEVNGLLCCFF